MTKLQREKSFKCPSLGVALESPTNLGTLLLAWYSESHTLCVTKLEPVSGQAACHGADDVSS